MARLGPRRLLQTALDAGVTELLGRNRYERRAVLGRTWPDCAPHSQIDHIMVTPQVRVLAGRVVGGLGSDHRAVRAELEI